MNMSTLCFRAFRLNTAVMAAAFITFLLFYFMQYLISTENLSFKEPSITRLIDATMPDFEDILIIKIPEPELVVLPDPPPQSPPVKDSYTPGGYQQILIVDPPALPGSDGVSIPLSRHMVPLVRATAPYPNRALSRGVEGFVELTFTVNELGRVVDPVVLYAEPEGYFERAALGSIQQWQYSPAMDDGVAVPVFDVRQRIVFTISDN
mgnify:CR=1 FL=1